MKQAIHILAFLFVSLHASAQEINYEVKYDNPDFKPFWNLNISYFDIDIPIGSIDAINFNAGLWGNIEPVEGIGIDYRFRRSYLTMAQIGYQNAPSFTNFELGGYFRFAGNTKVRPTKVILDVDWDADGNAFNNEQVYQVKSISIQAKKRRDYLLRGGFYHLSSPLTVSDLTDNNNQDIFADDLGAVSLNGLYTGIGIRTFTNVFIDTKQFGDQFNSKGTLIYLDAIFAGSSISDPYEEAATLAFNEELAKEAIGSLPIGFRIGMNTFQIEKKTRTGKKFGMSTNYEAGYRPYIGWYLSGGLGFTLVKWNK
ncbi:MAG: hypothetical protein ACPGVV_00085 [Croceimicrobium sp.]